MTTPYDLAVLADVPVSYWNLADPSGAVAADSAGPNPGAYAGGFTLNQAPPWPLMAGSTLFNGTTGYAEVPTAAGISPTAALSVEGWCWLTSAPRAGGFGTICEKGFSSNVAPFADYRLGAEESGRQFSAALGVGGTLVQIFSHTVPAAQTWHHLCMTFDGSTLVLYVDGFREATTSHAGPVNATGQPLEIGRITRGATTGAFFPGALAGVAVYNYALTPARVQAHAFGSGRPGHNLPPGVRALPASGLAVQPAWRNGLLASHVMRGWGPAAPDALGLNPAALGGPTSWVTGPWGQSVRYAGAHAQLLAPVDLSGLAAFTVSVLARSDTTDTTGAGSNQDRYVASQQSSSSSATWGMGWQSYGPAHIGAFVGATTVAPAAPRNLEWVLYTMRFRAGTIDVWFGPSQVGTVSGAPAAVPALGGNYLVGSFFTSGGDRVWSGDVAAHHVWGRALSDSEIVALAADPFAPVRPAPVRLGVLAPPSPASDPVPWLRGAAAAPRAARLSVTPASGWAPGLAEAADLLPWLRRAAAPAPPVPPPRALLAPWSPASAPAPDPLAWLLRAPHAPAPGARPPAAPQPGWRPEFAGGFAPPVRHALVRFWRGPQAHMPRLEEGEPAWATDTKSLWMGSASGNVRIGP